MPACCDGVHDVVDLALQRGEPCRRPAAPGSRRRCRGCGPPRPCPSAAARPVGWRRGCAPSAGSWRARRRRRSSRSRRRCRRAGPAARRRPPAAARRPPRSAGSTRATSSKPRTVASIASWSWAISHSSLTSFSSEMASASSRSRAGWPSARGAVVRPHRRVHLRVEAAQHPGTPRRQSASAAVQLGQVGGRQAQLGRLLGAGCAAGPPTARRCGCGRTRRSPGTTGAACTAWRRGPSRSGAAPARCPGRGRRSGRRSRCPAGTGSRCRWRVPSRCRSGSPASRRGRPPRARPAAWRSSAPPAGGRPAARCRASPAA